MQVEVLEEGRAQAVREVLEDLPEWFGNYDSVEEYVAFAGQGAEAVLVARDGEALVGVITLAKHYMTHAEINVLAVKRVAHGCGAGRALVAAGEAWARERGCAWYSVKTLSGSVPSPEYARTRAFYRAVGFAPFEELPEHWDPAAPCLIMLKAL